MKSSQDLAEQIDAAESRRAELEARLGSLETEIDGSREELGRAFAAGGNDAQANDLQARIRDLTDEKDGVERGLQQLTETVSALQAANQKAEVEEAEVERLRAIEEAEKACADLHSKVRDAARDILPVATSAKKALQDARAAEKNAVRQSGRRIFAGPRCRDLAWRVAGLLDVVDRLESLSRTES